MKIVVTSVFVDDQAKALQFYTEVLGFVKKDDVPLGASLLSPLRVATDEEAPGGGTLAEERPVGPLPQRASSWLAAHRPAMRPGCVPLSLGEVRCQR